MVREMLVRFREEGEFHWVRLLIKMHAEGYDLAGVYPCPWGGFYAGFVTRKQE